jgi:hypothetical protein
LEATMTRFEIARRRLYNQRLVAAPPSKPGEVVQWLGAVQAQDYSSAKWALGLRMLGATDGDIEHAFTDGSILRTHLLRPTWHFVAPGDIRWMLALTAPHVHKVNAYMYRQLGLDGATLQRSNDTLAAALQDGRQLTRDELRGALQMAGIATDGGLRSAYIMMAAELDGVVCSGARRGRQFTYALLDDRVPHARTLEREEALAELSRRYFMSRGPASVQDYAKWSGLTIVDATRGLDAVKAQLEHEVADGHPYWFPTPPPPANSLSPGAWLLSVYDEYLSGYKDRSAIGEAEVGATLKAMGNALSHVVVIDGQIVGTWKRTLRRDAVVVEMNPFNRLTAAECRAVNMAAQQYGEFLGLPAVLV